MSYYTPTDDTLLLDRVSLGHHIMDARDRVVFEAMARTILTLKQQVHELLEFKESVELRLYPNGY